MEQKTEQFMEALEVSKKIEEAGGVGQALKTVGRTIANAFGTAAGNAKRNAAAAQDALQTAQVNQQASKMNAEASQVDDVTLATQINKLLTTALKNANKNLTNVNNTNQQAQADRGEAKTKAKTNAAETPAGNGKPVNGANGETSTDAPQGANNGK